MGSKARAGFAGRREGREREVAAIFAAVLGRESVGAREWFFDVGGDSLLAARLVERIGEATGVEMTVVEFLEEPTVEGVCRRLEEPGRRSGGGGAKLRVIRGGIGAPALVCLPGASGDEAGFFHLARELGTGQPVWAFRYPGGEAGRYGIEELAERYVRKVVAAQARGPYHLAGVCTGGLVAFEMAKQLAGQGREVGVVALLDSYNLAWGKRVGAVGRVGYWLELAKRRAGYQVRAVRGVGWRGALGYLKAKGGAAAATAGQRWRARARRVREAAGMAGGDAGAAILAAAARYEPGEFAGRLILFRAEEPRVDGYAYPEMGWEGLARGGIEMHELAGSHLTVLGEAQARVVAGVVARAMGRAAIAG